MFRMKWDEFFNHPLFEQKFDDSPKDGTEIELPLNNTELVNKNFNLCKSNVISTKEGSSRSVGHDESLQKVAKTLAASKQLVEEDHTNSAYMQTQLKVLQDTEVMEENNRRYNYEKTKIYHLWQTVGKIRSVCKSIPNHPLKLNLD